MRRDFAHYAWSMRTLDRRLQHYDIHLTDRTVTVEEVRAAVSKELEGHGKFIGYRAMYHKIRQEHNLNAPRNLVHALMYDLDPEGLEARFLWERKEEKRDILSQKGPTGCTQWMAMTNLWGTKIAHSL